MVPGLGYLCLQVERGELPETPTAPTSLTLENEHLRVVVNPDGSLHSLVHKATGREALADAGNQLWLYPDVPREWEGWELDASYPLGGERLFAASAPERLPGQLEQAIRVTYDAQNSQAQGSEIVQTYMLRQGAKRLDIRTHAFCGRAADCCSEVRRRWGYGRPAPVSRRPSARCSAAPTPTPPGTPRSSRCRATDSPI